MDTLSFSYTYSIDYNAYVHFAYHVGRYLMHQCIDQTCAENKIIDWYLGRFRRLLSRTHPYGGNLNYLYRQLVNNLIRDECVTVAADTPEGRMIQKHPIFFIWAWRSDAKSYENDVFNV